MQSLQSSDILVAHSNPSTVTCILLMSQLNFTREKHLYESTSHHSSSKKVQNRPEYINKVTVFILYDGVKAFKNTPQGQ
jgi:hypothetical protein